MGLTRGSEGKEEVERDNGKSPFCFLFPPGGKKWGEALLSILPFFLFLTKDEPLPPPCRVKSLLKIDAHSKKMGGSLTHKIVVDPPIFLLPAAKLPISGHLLLFSRRRASFSRSFLAAMP